MSECKKGIRLHIAMHCEKMPKNMARRGSKLRRTIGRNFRSWIKNCE